MKGDFTEAELLAALAGLTPDGDGGPTTEEFVALLSQVGEAGVWTDDTLMLLSITSPELERRVGEMMAPIFAGEDGEERRRAWEERRAQLKHELKR